ncbi:oligopeptide/dipeptide ABC transporter, ATP-binding protein, C-terminal domain-containing protein [Rhizobiales bacterium GAS113]|nr:oligopeptide/dipeptide ABC transporter, ATP-binding protein, C-terminal domain-containing protein [Rhizobiales bacterium GAS113]
MENPPPLLSIRDLTVDLMGVNGAIRLIHPFSFEIAKGQTVGIVGESGCGKSLTWLAALQLQPKSMLTGGRVLLDGRNLLELGDEQMSRVRGGRIALIFQDPSSSLNPVLTIGRQIGEVLAVHRGFSGGSILAEARRLIESVGIADAPRRLRQYPHEFSGGMNQRAMIAMALAGAPDLLVADEPTTALDVTIQAQILDLLQQVQKETGMGLVLISHDLGTVSDMCERIVVMYAGRVAEIASTEILFSEPLHPYTRGLLAAFPDLDGPRKRLETIPGTVPAPGGIQTGCSFASRCSYAAQECGSHDPVLEHAATDHLVACIRLKAIRAQYGLPPQSLHADAHGASL